MKASTDYLPAGWTVATIESLAEPKGIAYGVLKPGPPVSGGVPMLRVSDIKDGSVHQSSMYRISEQLNQEYRRTKLRGGEVVVSIQGSVGRAAVVPVELAGANVSRTLAMIRLRDPALAEWVLRALESPQAQQAMRRAVGGTTRDSLNLRDLRQIEIPVAPEPQRSSLLRLLDQVIELNGSSHRHLSASRRAVERFRRAALAAACSGRLTADWREIHVARRRKAEVPLRRSDSPSAGHFESAEFDLDELPELPASWQWAPLATVSERMLGKMLDKAKNKGELHPYLRNVNVRWRGFDLSEVQMMRFAPGEEGRYGLRSGDVLVCEGGEPGRAAVWREDGSDMRFQKAIHRVRCNDALLPDWLVNVLEAHSSSGVLAAHFTGSGIAHLTGVSLARLPVPLPPIDEQAEIVRRLERMLALAGSAISKIAGTQDRIDRGLQAVLAGAFRGDLIPAGAESLSEAG